MDQNAKECKQEVQPIAEKYGLTTLNFAIILYIRDLIRKRKQRRLKYEDLKAVEEQYGLIHYLLTRKTKIWKYLNEFHYWSK